MSPKLRTLTAACFFLLPALACTTSAPPEQAAPTDLPATHSAEVAPAEVYDVFYIAGSKVGYGKTTIERDADGNLTTTSQNELKMRRFGQTVRQSINLVSTIDADGELIQCESHVASGPQPQITRAEVRGGKLHLTTGSQGKQTNSTIKWKAAWGGYFASDHSLRRRPMKPGERRTIKSLAPIFNQVSTTELTAGKVEATEMLDGKRDLLRIEQKTTIGNQTIPSTVWTDESGEPVKIFVPGMRQITYRVSKERALREESDGGFDLGQMTIVKARMPAGDVHQTKALTYKATLETGNPAEVFAAGTSQRIKPIDEHTAEITVLAVRPDQPAEASDHDGPPTAADLEPNNLIQSDNAKIGQMAASILPEETDPWTLSLAVERYVKRAVRSKNFSTAFATAAEVADSLEGDCTEHAVLFAALCRARQIPARVAMGLVYYRPEGGFAYHMWTEVWIEDRWIPLDATLGRGGIGGGHLKIAHANLAGAEAYSVFLPAQQVIGQLELEIVGNE